MEYKLEKSKRKTISIQILQNGDIFVKAPLKTNIEFINNFVLSKKKWIITHQQKILEENKKFKYFYCLDKLLVFGEIYNLYNTNEITICGIKIRYNNQQQKVSKIKKLLKKISEEYILKQTEIIAKKLNLSYSNIKIASAKKKWGSCSSKKELKFNYKLAMLPKDLIDYVICHELCHLKELNHSPKFWQLLENLGYNKANIRKQMKEFGFVLNIF